MVSGKKCGFHSIVMEKSGFLECDFASLDKWFPIFRRNVRGHSTSYAVSHPKIPKYWLKLFVPISKTIGGKKKLCLMRFLDALAKVWKRLLFWSCLSVCLSVCQYECLALCPTVCLTVSLPDCLSVCLSVRLSDCLPSVLFHLSIHPSAWNTRLPLNRFSWKMIFNYFSKFCQKNMFH